MERLQRRRIPIPAGKQHRPIPYPPAPTAGIRQTSRPPLYKEVHKPRGEGASPPHRAYRHRDPRAYQKAYRPHERIGHDVQRQVPPRQYVDLPRPALAEKPTEQKGAQKPYPHHQLVDHKAEAAAAPAAVVRPPNVYGSRRTLDSPFLRKINPAGEVQHQRLEPPVISRSASPSPVQEWDQRDFSSPPSPPSPARPVQPPLQIKESKCFIRWEIFSVSHLGAPQTRNMFKSA